MTARTRPLPQGYRGLTVFQRGVLQYAALGYTYRATAKALGSTPKSVSHTARLVMAKLEARNITHAVYIATAAGVISRHPCGDYRTYMWHIRNGVPLDEACRGARRRYDKAHPWKGRREGL